MKIIHFSDTHLWAWNFQTWRDEDFYKNFLEVIDLAIKENPDFILHSWDLFHYSKPSNKALSVAMEGFLKISKAWIKTIIIAWNHSTPRWELTSHPFEIFKEIENFYMVNSKEIQTFEFEKVNFVCLSHQNDQNNFKIELSKAPHFIKNDKINIFTSHFWIKNTSYKNYTDEISGIDLDSEDLLQIEDFDYVWLWHYHKNFCFWRKKNLCYSWSTEKTSFSQKDYKCWFNIIKFNEDKTFIKDFVQLKTRKMIQLNIDCENYTETSEIIKYIESQKIDIKWVIIHIFLENITKALWIKFDDKLFKNYFSESLELRYIKEKKEDGETKININIEEKDNFVNSLFEDFIKQKSLDKSLDKNKIKEEILNDLKNL